MTLTERALVLAAGAFLVAGAYRHDPRDGPLLLVLAYLLTVVVMVTTPTDRR